MKYNVCRYFDDVFETVIESFDNYKDARKKADELNNSVRAYVEYLVREEAQQQVQPDSASDVAIPVPVPVTGKMVFRFGTPIDKNR